MKMVKEYQQAFPLSNNTTRIGTHQIYKSQVLLWLVSLFPYSPILRNYIQINYELLYTPIRIKASCLFLFLKLMSHQQQFKSTILFQYFLGMELSLAVQALSELTLQKALRKKRNIDNLFFHLPYLTAKICK